MEDAEQVDELDAPGVLAERIVEALAGDVFVDLRARLGVAHAALRGDAQQPVAWVTSRWRPARALTSSSCVRMVRVRTSWRMALCRARLAVPLAAVRSEATLTMHPRRALRRRRRPGGAPPRRPLPR